MDESKLAPNLLARLREPRALEAGVPPVPVIIKYRADATRTQVVKEGIAADYVYKLTPTVAAGAPGQDVLELTDDPQIEYIWLDEEVHTCLDRSVPAIGVPAVWSAGYRGTGVKVAVVDTGIDREHPDFAGRIVTGSSFVGGDYSDDNGHGTHVAGIIAGSGAKYRGVAPEAMLYIAKVLDRNGSGSMSGVMAGVEWAVEQGVRVINLSLGGSGSSDGQDALSLTCNAAVAHDIVVCVAAGNAGPGSRTIGSPGAAADVITIGAVDRSDRVADFSSRGPTADGRTKPDVCLPGVGIVSARAAGTSMGEPVDELYTAASGTSMATPHATGVAALLRQAVSDLSPDQVKSALMETALDLGQPANTQGAGRVRADYALNKVLNKPEPEPTPTPPDDGKKGCLPTFLVPLLGR
jgi:subtilisin family serine protease